jgi:RNA polymerase sigma-70 factor (ECF subfamily)
MTPVRPVTPVTPVTPAVELEAHRRLLWALAYRMTGVAADADDIVQETFARTLSSPPKTDRPLRPWLVTVTMNLARDALRRRKRTTYVGPWLPSPVDDDALALSLGDDARAQPEARYGVRESATFAFLVALEALTPQRRAVLILRDVFDYSTEETARALGMREDSVKQALTRARRALVGYEARRAPLEEKRARDQAAMSRLFIALAAGDVNAVQDLLADDVEAHSDGAGKYTASRIVLHGPQKVATVYANLTRIAQPDAMTVREMNGTTVAVLSFTSRDARLAPLIVMQVETNAHGEISRVYSVMADDKLSHLARNEPTKEPTKEPKEPA